MIRILIDRLHSLENKRYISAAGLSTDEKPLENLITGSVFSEIDTGKLYKFDEAGNAWIEQGGASGGMTGGRVTALEGSALAQGTVIDAVGIPAYVSDVSAYTAYGITDTGWYVFARIDTPEGVTVSAETTVEGAAGYIAQAGETHVDVAIRFEVAAQSHGVTVDWGENAETFIFRAADLAIRNLDYRTTFYIYDIAPYATWEYALTTDTEFVADKHYFTKDGDTYTRATVTAGDAVPANTYYNHSLLHFEGMIPNVTYRLNEIVDCPIEIVLPNIPNDGHGAWFEIQMRYDGSYSCTLLPPMGVVIGTAQTQAQTAGMNTIDLQYTDVDNCQVWTLLNTHSNFTIIK